MPHPALFNPSVKKALITGASSGIGLATAKVLAKDGYNLILLARRLDKLTALANELSQQYEITCFAYACDLSQSESINNFYDKLPKELRKIDVLINNAGSAKGIDKLQDANPTDWDEMIDTNLKGLLYLTHKFLSHMIEDNNGHIINLGSISGHSVYAGGAVYCATKHAVHAISQGLRLDLVGTDIRVTEISPGLVETEFSVVRFKGDEEKAKQVYQGFAALTPEDIADVIRYSINCPRHVNISEVVIMPTAQAGVGVVHKKK